jgi:DNA-binding NtrC family response regulator
MDKILLVDDESAELHGYQRVLHRRYHTEGVEDPFRALELIQSGEYSVIVSDYRMPGMDGLELLRKTMEVAPDTVRILLTGVQDWDVAMKAVNECQVYRFLTKPVPQDTLLAVLHGALDQHRLNLLLSSELERQGVPVQKPVPICSYCKDVRISDENVRSEASWERIEVMLNRRFGLQFSHGVCPKCAEKLYREIARQNPEPGGHDES